LKRNRKRSRNLLEGTAGSRALLNWNSWTSQPFLVGGWPRNKSRSLDYGCDSRPNRYPPLGMTICW